MRWTGPAWAAACVALVTCVAVTAGAAGAPTTGGNASRVPSCTCTEARLTDGWCKVHGAGYVAMVRIPSRLLYDTLDAHGHDLDLSAFTCHACREAVRTEGFCEEHRNGFVRKLAYFSRLTYEMARGERLDPDLIDCRACRRNAKGLGWCDRDGRGMVGNVALRERGAYERAAAAAEVLRAATAMAARCEYCAMAMVTDTECWNHKIAYRGGRPVP